MYFLRRLASNEIRTPKCPVSSILIDTRGESYMFELDFEFEFEFEFELDFELDFELKKNF